MGQHVADCQEGAVPREDRERRYIADYMVELMGNQPYSLNVPLGPIPEEITARHGLSAGAALFRPSRPRIDATAWTPEGYWLIEAKIREAKSAIGDLLVYSALAAKTLDLPGYTGQPIKMRLVVPWALDWIQQAAEAHGMELRIYLPAWVEQYVRDHQLYFTREYRIARDEKMRLRKTLGVD